MGTPCGFCVFGECDEDTNVCICDETCIQTFTETMAQMGDGTACSDPALDDTRACSGGTCPADGSDTDPDTDNSSNINANADAQNNSGSRQNIIIISAVVGAVVLIVSSGIIWWCVRRRRSTLSFGEMNKV